MIIIAAVYAILGPRNHAFVASSTDVFVRFRSLRTVLRQGKYHNERLQRAWIRRGSYAFTFVILERCGSAQLAEREDYWHQRLGTTKGGYSKIDVSLLKRKEGP